MLSESPKSNTLATMAEQSGAGAAMQDHKNPYRTVDCDDEVSGRHLRQARVVEICIRVVVVSGFAAVGPITLGRFLFNGTFMVSVPIRIVIVFLPGLVAAAVALFIIRRTFWRKTCVLVALGSSVAVGFVPVPTFLVLERLDPRLPSMHLGELIVYAIATVVSAVLLVPLSALASRRATTEPTPE